MRDIGKGDRPPLVRRAMRHLSQMSPTHSVGKRDRAPLLVRRVMRRL